MKFLDQKGVFEGESPVSRGHHRPTDCKQIISKKILIEPGLMLIICLLDSADLYPNKLTIGNTMPTDMADKFIEVIGS
ncbi:MAG: hypothetical protein ACKO5Z_09950 [Burkholderiaceae bacterium]